MHRFNIDEAIAKLAEKLVHYNEVDQQMIVDAALWANKKHDGQLRNSGEPYITHPLGVATILVEMRMDAPTIIAALLHDVVEDTETSSEEISLRYSEEIAQLVDGVTKISITAVKDKQQQTTETLHKLFVAMSNDIRVVLIKLADKLHNMTTLLHKKRAKQITTAQECLDIYAPLAAQLGIYWLKVKLEDLAFLYIDPEANVAITAYLTNTEIEQIKICNQLKNYFSADIKAYYHVSALSLVPRSHYTVYRMIKENVRNLVFLNYPYGVQIICQNLEDCYRILGYIHQKFQPLEGQIQDFIASPKENQYQGLHTMVMNRSGAVFQIQIRTEAMNNIAQYGVISFWACNAQQKPMHFNPQDLNLITRLKAWNALDISGRSYIDGLKREILGDKITIFNQQGTSLAMPIGSTALDFAFRNYELSEAIFTKKIEVNNRVVGFDYPLHLRDKVVIEFAEKEQIELQWLNYLTNDETIGLIKKYYQRQGFELYGADEFYFALPLVQPAPEIIEVASCCMPMYGEDITLVPQAARFCVHRANCSQYANQREKIAIVWRKITLKQFRIEGRALYGINLLAKIEQVMTQNEAVLLKFSVKQQASSNFKRSKAMEFRVVGQLGGNISEKLLRRQLLALEEIVAIE